MRRQLSIWQLERSISRVRTFLRHRVEIKDKESDWEQRCIRSITKFANRTNFRTIFDTLASLQMKRDNLTADYETRSISLQREIGKLRTRQERTSDPIERSRLKQEIKQRQKMLKHYHLLHETLTKITNLKP